MLVLCTACWEKEVPDKDNGVTASFVEGRGVLVYTGYQPLQHKPVNIHYYIPQGADMATMPILMVLPGVNRDADDYLSAWVDIAQSKKLMVFSLEYPKSSYSSSQYIEGGMFSGQQLLPEAAWTFSMIEPLFDYIKHTVGGRQQGYDLFGHSAGAQFVHRFMTFKPRNRVLRAVSANAGWYTAPDFAIAYPYGLKNSPATAQGLATLLGKQFFVHLGTADTDPKSANLNHEPGSDAQGMYRYARGLYYWGKAQDASQAMHVPLAWQKVETKGVAHDYGKMSKAASKFLY